VDEAEAMEGVADLSPCGSRSRSQSMGGLRGRSAVRLDSSLEQMPFGSRGQCGSLGTDGEDREAVVQGEKKMAFVSFCP
jgi:hypothetical protein